jgi:hypothetical protein
MSSWVAKYSSGWAIRMQDMVILRLSITSMKVMNRFAMERVHLCGRRILYCVILEPTDRISHSSFWYQSTAFSVSDFWGRGEAHVNLGREQKYSSPILRVSIVT